MLIQEIQHWNLMLQFYTLQELLPISLALDSKIM